MTRTVRNNKVDEPYSLHDSHIRKIKVLEIGDKQETNLKILFKDGFYVPKDKDALPIRGKLLFEKVDMDFSNVYVMKVHQRNGKISGRKYTLQSFTKKCGKVDMEIIDATYGYNTSKFSGYMYEKRQIKEFVIEIYHFGNMVYFTENE
jgi:hypothetical protein